MSDKQILTMRAMSWQRAKGDLQTFWPDNKEKDNGYKAASEKIKEFIENMEQ